MTPSDSDRALRAASALVRLSPLLCLAPLTLFIAASPALAQTRLDEVVVTANRTPQALSSVLADISIIDRDEIERAGVSGVADLLARQPGIEISRNGGLAAATSVFIRGGETRHTAVYLDGVRVDSQATGGVMWEQIPLAQIDRIEVLRGPAAAVYGSDAVAGVIQLFTRRGSGPARPSASLTVGSYNTVQGRVGISGASDVLSYSLSASQGRSDGFDATQPGAFGHNPDRDGWHHRSLQGRVGYQVDSRHRLEASLLASELNAGYDGSASTDDQSHSTLRTGSLAWQSQWNAQATTRLQVGQSASTYETRPSFYRTETTLSDYTLLHEQRVGASVLTGTIERRVDKLFNPATAFAPALAGERHQDAIGLGWRFDVGNHGLQAHVRRDKDSEFGGERTGSLAWGWAFLPAWRLTASSATSFRAPTLYQRFSEYGNAALVPESGRHVELGLRWAAAGSRVSLTAWRNKVSNLIAFGPPGPCVNAFGCFFSVDRAELEGVTLAGRTRWAGVTLRGSLDWRDPRNADTGTVLPRRAKRLATFGAETMLSNWTVGTEVQAAGIRFENATNTQTLAGYALLNLYASTLLRPGLYLDARINNLGDRDYGLARNFATAGRNAQVSLRWML